MDKQTKPKRRFEHWHLIASLLIVFDMISVNASYLLALFFRFDCIYSAIP